MKMVQIDTLRGGLNESTDPGLLIVPKSEETPNQLVSKFGTSVRNIIFPDGRSMRTSFGYSSEFDEAFYSGGTNGKVFVLAKKDATEFLGNIILCIKQVVTTGTVHGTPVAGFCKTTTDIFTPDHIGCVIKNTTSGNKTIVTRYVTQSLVKVNNDHFGAGTGGNGVAVYGGGQIKGAAEYLIDGTETLDNNTLVSDLITESGEMTDDEFFYITMFQDRLFILSGTNRGWVLHKDQFYPLGFLPAYDNNSLAIDVSSAGKVTASAKWALVFQNGDTLKQSPPMYIENGSAEDGFYSLANKRLTITLATLPTNAIDKWSHYILYRKQPEWPFFKEAARITKNAAVDSGTTTGGEAYRLQDSGAAWTEDQVGLTAVNAEGGTSLITGRDSATSLILEEDIFDGGNPYFKADGYTTSVVSDKLVDTNAAFDSSHLNKKVRLWDYSANATITNIDSATQVTLDSHIFTGTNVHYVILNVNDSVTADEITDATFPFSETDLGRWVQDEDGNVAKITTYYSTSRVGLSAAIMATGEGYDFDDGTSTSTLADNLVDNRQTWTAAEVGEVYFNQTGGAATVTAFVSSSTLTMNDDIFTYGSGESYSMEFGDNRQSSVVAVGNSLIESRTTPAGRPKCFVFNNRIFYYGGYSADVTGVSITNGSKDVTLATSQAEEWMIGKDMFISGTGVNGAVPYQIKNVKSGTSIELFQEWQGEDVSGGTATISANVNKIEPGFATFADCELTHPLMEIEVRPYDGDQIMHVGVVRGVPIVLKQRGVFALQIDSINDPIANEIPAVLYRAIDMRSRHGCIGLHAACQDTNDVLYWFSGRAGIFAYQGNTIVNMSEQVKDYFLTLDETKFYKARMCYNTSTDELLLVNLSTSTDDGFGLALSVRTGQWREISELEVTSHTFMQVKR